MAVSTCERSLRELKEKGIKAGKVEMPWNSYSMVRKDYLNIIDIIALDCNTAIGIQACGADIQSHIEKLTVEFKENSIAWLNSNNRLQIWAWRKVKYKRGSIAMRWNLKKIEFYLVNLNKIEYREIKTEEEK